MTPQRRLRKRAGLKPGEAVAEPFDEKICCGMFVRWRGRHDWRRGFVLSVSRKSLVVRQTSTVLSGGGRRKKLSFERRLTCVAYYDGTF